MKNRLPKIICGAGIAFSVLRCGWDIFERYKEFLAKGAVVPTFVLITGVLLFGTLFLGLLLLRPRTLAGLRELKEKLPAHGAVIGGLVCALPAVLYNFLEFCEPYQALGIRVFIALCAITLGAWCMEREDALSALSWVRSALCFSVFFVLLTQFRDVSAYPFSIGWSEGNRMWDYSVLFGKRLYNFPQDQDIPAYIDVGRQSLWGAVFLLPKVSIVGMRFWNDILFTLPCAFLGWALLKQDRASKFRQKAAFALWAMLFLTQGPIYTPLTLAALAVALAHGLPLILNALPVAAAGFYAVMSRSTWIAAPAAYAVFLAFLEKDKAPKERWSRALVLGLSGLAGAGIYMKRDLLFGFFGAGKTVAETTEGAAAAAAAMEAVPPIFTPAWFAYYLNRQPLLWDRLWPNDTYHPGIVLGLAQAVLPLVLLLVIWSLETKWKKDLWQKLLLYGGSSIFLGVGLVISIKIGGGSNLHNMDMFLILLLMTASAALSHGFGGWLREKIMTGHWVTLIVLAAVLIPCWTSFSTTSPKRFPDPVKTADALDHVQAAVREHADEDILFMDQRQLLTFGLVDRVPLVADYEKKWMMDEAMADDADYFAPYISDMKARRFGLIVTEPLHIKFQGAGGDFSEENDLFVKWVSLPTLCYYEPLETFDEQGVQLLVPRASVLEQEGVTCP